MRSRLCRSYKKKCAGKDRLKTLSVATFISLFFLGANNVQAEDVEHKNFNIENKKLEFVIPSALNNGVMTGAATPIMDNFAGTPIKNTTNYISSLIAFHEITPDDPDNLAPNVIKYYNPNEDSDLHYYEIVFKNPEIGEGELSKYYKWTSVNGSCKLIETNNITESVLTIKYDNSTYIDKIVNSANSEINNISNKYLNQNIKASISNSGTINSITSRFVENLLDISNTDGENYVAITQKVDGSIGTINSDFIGNAITINTNNSVPVYGTLVKSLGNLGEITSEFISNTVTSNAVLEGGLLYTSEKGSIGKIQSDFIYNTVTTDYKLDGTVIANLGTIDSIESSLFYGNTGKSSGGTVYGGVLYNPGRITNGINNSIFLRNNIESVSGNAYGGAIYNTKALEIVNSSFIGNSVKSINGNALGGAIYTDTTLTIKADNGISEFSGNYVENNGVKESSAIYVDTKIGGLTFNAINGGNIILSDAINGISGYSTTLTGDSTGLIQLNNKINNTVLLAENTNISYINNRTAEAEYISLAAYDTAKWRIDIDYENNKTDTIKAGEGSQGKIWIDEINLINGVPEQTSIIKILTGDGNLQLGLTARAIADNTKETKTQTGSQKETITPTAVWSKVFSEQIINDVVNESIALYSSGGNGVYDSIEYSVVRTVQYDSESSQGDTLKLLNQYENGGTRNFNASRANETYTVTEDLGTTTAGQMNVTGKYDALSSIRSTLNAGEHTLFELSEDDAKVQIKDVNINTNSNKDGSIIDATNSTANSKMISTAGTMTVNAPNTTNAIINNGTFEYNAQNGSTINTNTGITGTGSTVLAGIINFTDGASINQANISINSGANVSMGTTGIITGVINNLGTLNIDADNLLGNIFNYSHLKLQAGDLNYDITGSGNTYIYGELNVTDGKLLNQVNVYFAQNGTKLIIDADNLTGNIQRLDETVDYSTLSIDLKSGTLDARISLNKDVTVNILGDVKYNKNVVPKTVIGEGCSLTTTGEKRSGLIENNGTIYFTSGTDSMPDSYNYSDVTISGTGDIVIKDGTFASRTKYDQDSIHILDGATFSIYNYSATPFEVNDLIIDGIFKVASYNPIITPDTVKNISGNGKFEVDNFRTSSEALQVYGYDLTQNIEIMENASLTTIADNLKGTDSTVVNNGSLYLGIQDSTLSKDIWGDGTLNIYSNIQNEANIYNKIFISSNKSLTSNADLLKNTVSSSGNLYLTGGTAQYTISGGNVYIQDNSDVISNASLSGNIYIKTGGSLTISGNNLASKITLLDDSNLYLTGGTAKRDILGENGTVNITGDVLYDSEVGSIEAKVEIADGGKFTVDAANLKNAYIDNLSQLYLSGDMDKEIQGGGTTYINETLVLNPGSQIDGNFNLNNGELSFVKDNYDSYNLGTAVGSGDLVLNINIPESEVATLDMTDASTAVFYVTGGNIKLADETSIGATGTAQILIDNSSSTLALKDGNFVEFRDTHFDEQLDDVHADVYYDDEFYLHTNLVDFIGTIELATKDKAYDSIKWTITDKQFIDDVATEADLLTEWVKLETEDTKYFRFRTAEDVYNFKVPEDVNHKFTEIGTAAKGILNIVGVADENSKAVINLDGLSGITLNQNTVFNASNVKIINGLGNIIYLNQGNIGSIDNEHIISGGLNNVSLTNNTATGIDKISVQLLNSSIIYQITDSDFSKNDFNYTNEDTSVKITTYSGVIGLGSNTSIGTKYTNNDNETVWVGGIYNTKFSDNISIVKSLNASIYGCTLNLIGGTVANIVDSEFSNNIIDSKLKAQVAGGSAIYLQSSARIHNIENTKFLGNMVILEQDATEKSRSIGTIFARGTSYIDIIKGCLFKDNKAPVGASLGGHYAEYMNISSIDNTVFDSNSAESGNGGAINMATIGEIKNSQFKNNTAYNKGGAISTAKIDLIENTIFVNNSSNSGGGAINGATIAEIKNSDFINNTVSDTNYDHRGGAIYANVNVISDSYFSGNTARSGGAIHEWSANTERIINTTFDSNYVSGYGGAIYNLGKYIINSTFNNNVAPQGGAIYAGANVKEISSSTFTNNNVYGNSAIGGAIYIISSNTGLNISDSVFNSNFAFSTLYDSSGGAITSASSNTVNITNSSFYDNYINSFRHGYGGAIINNGSGAINIIADNNISEIKGNYVKSRNNRDVYGGAIYNSADGIINVNAKNNGIVSLTDNKIITSNKTNYGGSIYSLGNLSIKSESGGNIIFKDNFINRNGNIDDNAIYMGSSLAILTLDARGNGNIYLYDNINGVVTSNQAYQTVLTGDNTENTGTIHLYNQILNSDISVSGVNVDMIDNNLTTYNIRKLTSADSAKYSIDINFDTEEADVFKLSEDSSGIIYINDLNILGEGVGKKTVQIIKSNNSDVQLRLNPDIFDVGVSVVETLGDTVYNDEEYKDKIGYSLATTNTYRDSITKVMTEQKYNAMQLIASSINNTDRTFEFRTDDTYYLSDDIGAISPGSLTIKGLTGGSTINADGHKMFNVTNYTDLNIYDTKLTNADGAIITVNNENAQITLQNSYIDGNITGGEKFRLNIAGTGKTTINGTVTNADTVVNSGELIFNTDTFDVNSDSLTVNGGKIDLANGEIETYNINSIISKTEADYIIDYNPLSNTVDTILSKSSVSSGIVKISDVNFIKSIDNEINRTVRVLYNASDNHKLQLNVADDISYFKLKDIDRIESDEVVKINTFNDKYYDRLRKGDLYCKIELATSLSGTTYDSLKFTSTAIWEDTTTPVSYHGDTLALVNQASINDRRFTSSNAGEVYTSTDNVGETGSGDFLILGINSTSGVTSQKSTINLAGYEGFELGDSTLTINGIRITGAKNDTIITAMNSNAQAIIGNTFFDGNIIGNEKFNLILTGDEITTITGKIINADVRLIKGGVVITPETFKDSNTSLTATAEGVVTSINMQNDKLEDYYFNDLNSTQDVNYHIDIDLTNRQSDTINVTGNNSSGTIKLESFNIMGMLSGITVDDNINIPILYTNGNNIDLKISETIAAQTDTDYNLGSASEVSLISTLNPVTKWSDELTQTTDTYDIVGRLALSQDGDIYNLKLYHLKANLVSNVNSLGDTLAIWNTTELEGNPDKSFIDDTSGGDDIYNVTMDLGVSTAGNMSIVGKDKNSTISLNDYQGFVLDNVTNMSVENVTFKNANFKKGSLFDISNEDAVLNLNNVTVTDTQSVNAINNNGTVNMVGGDVLLNSGITGSGETYVKNGTDVVLGGGVTITQQKVNIENGTLTAGTSGRISAAITVSEDGILEIEASGIDGIVSNDGQLKLNSGTLTKAVTGDGKTILQESITSSANITQGILENKSVLTNNAVITVGKLVNDAASIQGLGSIILTGESQNLGKISQNNLTLNAGAELITNASDINISNIISNDGTLIFTGGKLVTEVSGDGNTTINGTVTNTVAINQAVNVTSDGDFSVGAGIGALTNAGVVIVNANNLKGSVSNSNLITLTGGTLAQTVSGLGSVTVDGTVNTTTAINQVVNVTTDGNFSAGADIGALINKGLVTINANSIKGAVSNSNLITLTGGTLAQSISGLGSTTITGTVENTAVVNQDIEVKSTGALTVLANVYNVLNEGTISADADYLNGSITNNNDVILTAGTLTQAIVGSGNTKINGSVSNTVAINQDVTVNEEGTFNVGANINNLVNNGIVTSTTNYLTKTITNNSGAVLNLQGILNKTIAGTGTTKIDSDLTLTNTAKIDGILDLNNGTLSVKDSSITTYTIESMLNNGNVHIDVNGSKNTSDKFTVGANSNGTLLIDSINWITNPTQTFKAQILNSGTSDMKLSLSDTIAGTVYDFGTTASSTQDDVANPVTAWNAELYNYTISKSYLKGVIGLAKTQTDDDSIAMSTYTVGGNRTNNYLLDTLYEWNKLNITTDKSFVFESENDVYDAIVNLGETNGVNISVNGVHSGELYSTINFGDFNGFETQSGQTLNINNMKINGNGTIISSDGTLNISNSVLNGNITGDGTIAVSGITALSGEIASVALTNTGTLNNSAVINITGKIINSGIITSAANLITAAEITNDNSLKLTQGTLSTPVNGEGSTEISGPVSNSVTINQAVSVISNGDFTVGANIGALTNAGTVTASTDNLTGTITNNGDLYLSGVLSKSITGNGTTYINTALILNDSGNIVGELDLNGNTLTLSSGNTTSHNIGKITTNGNLVLDINGLSDTSDIINITGQDSNSVLTITTLNLTKPVVSETENSKVYTKQILTGVGNTSDVILALSSDVTDIYNTESEISRTGTDKLNNGSILWNTDYGEWSQTGTQIEAISITSSSGVLRDSIKYTLNKTWNAKTFNTKFDNLALINTYTGDGSANRLMYFTGIFDDTVAQGVYTVTSDLGTSSAGILTLNGVTSGTVNTTIDLNNHRGFEIANATTLNLNNINITDLSDGKTAWNTTVATVTNSDATIELNNAIINGAITGTTVFDINTSGMTELNGMVSNANITNNGTLTTGFLNLTNSTITNNATFNLRGDLIQDVYGTGATILTEESSINNDITIIGILDFNNNTLNMSNGSYEVLTVGNLSGNGNLTVDTDARTITGNADEIHINNTGSNSTITITELNMITPSTIAEDIYIYQKQILTGNTAGATLALDAGVAESYYNQTAINRSDTDILTTNAISWNANYGGWEQTGTQTSSVAIAGSSGTSQDSIKYEINKVWNSKNYTSKVENLAIMNKYTGSDSDNRSVDFTGIFEAPNTGTYTITSDLGTSAVGTYTLYGEQSGTTNTTLDLNGHNGFVLANATNLNLNNINIGDSANTPATTIIATVTNTSATVGLNNVTLNGNIIGSGFEVTTTGTTTLNGTVGGNITNNGTLNSSLANIAGTYTNNNTYNLTGDITKDIAGTGTTIIQSTTSAITADRTVAGTLNLNGKTLEMSDSAYETLSVGKLSGNGSITLNADATTTTGNADKINITGTGSNSSVITIAALNMTTPASIEGDSYTYQKQILTGNTSGASLVFGSGADTPYNTSAGINRNGTETLATNAINWDANYGGWTQSGTQTTSVTIVDSSTTSLQDSIKYTVNKSWNERVYTGKVENLAIMNSYSGDNSNNRSVDFTGIFNPPTNGTYTVASDLGTSSAGTYTLNGVTSGENNTTVDLNGHNGFVLANATTLNINNINLTGNTTLITVNNSDSDINLTNTDMQGAITGSVEYDITTAGANSLQGVSNARVANGGALSLSGTNNLVNITNTTGTTEITAGTTTVSSIVQNTLTVDSGATLTNNGTTSSVVGGSNAGTINGNGKLTNSGVFSNTGTIHNNISNSGTYTNAGTGITGNVENTNGTFTNNAQITGTVTTSGGTFNNNALITGAVDNAGTMTSTAANLGSTINNTGILNLSGTLAKAISGNGTTVVNSALTLNNNSGIAGILDLNNGTITVSEGSVTTTSIGALKGTGNFALDIAYDGATVSSDVINLTADTTDSATIKIISLIESGIRLSDFTQQIIAGADANTVLDITSVKAQFDMDSDVVYKSVAKDLTTPSINWNGNYGTENWTETYKRELLVTGSQEGLSDSIQYKSTFIDASVHTWNPKGDNLAIINKYDGAGSEDRTFSFDTKNDKFTVTEDLGSTQTGDLTINGVSDGEKLSTIDFSGKSGFELSNAGTTLNIKDVEATGANCLINATANDSIVNLDNVILDGTNGGISSNGTINVTGNSSIDDTIAITGGTLNVLNNTALGGNVTLNGTTVAAIKDNSIVSGNITLNDTASASFSNNAVLNGDIVLSDSATALLSDNSTVSGDITLNNTTKLNITGDNTHVTGKIIGDSTAKLNVKDGSFKVRNTVSGVNTVLDNGKLILSDESLFTAGLTINAPSNISMQNNTIGALNFSSLTLNDTLTMQIDADLALKTIDTIDAGTITINGGSINVDKINILHPTTEHKLSLLFTNKTNLASIVRYTGDGEIVYSPIYKYTTTYENKDGQGYFNFILPSKGGGENGGESSYMDFNPAVLSTPAMAQAGMQANMNATMNYAFQHSDGFTKLRAMDRFAAINANKYALAEGASTDFNENMSDMGRFYENKGAWVRPYASFENVPLKNGPRVDAISYGTLVGFDTDFKELKHGWDTVFTGYLGYNGAHLTYQGVSTTMNGGILGGTQTWYKGNFWTALTATAGASVAESDTMYGHESNASIMAGVGSKTGYNFEFKEGRFIIQPIWFMNYSMMKTFDYTNAAGVRIDSDPLHTIQLNPSVRFIGNLNHGWQPYASVGMVWNLMNETKVKAAGVKLPEMSIKPYVEYGVGVQKQIGDRFTGFFQAMMRNGGRNGIALTGGFRWALGRDGKPIEKVQGVNSKQVKAEEIKPTNEIKVSDKKTLKQVQGDKSVQGDKKKSSLKTKIDNFFAKMNGEI